MQKGQALVFLLVGILVIVVTGGAFYLGRSTLRQNPSGQATPNPSPTSQSTSTPSTTTSDETANWKIFTNVKKEIMFKYPPIWKVEETHGGGGNPDSEFSFFPLNVTPDITVGDHAGNSEMIVVISPQDSPDENKNYPLLQNKYPISRADDGKSPARVYNEIGTMSAFFIFTENAQSYLDQILSTFRFD